MILRLYTGQLFESKLQSYQITHKAVSQDFRVPLQQRMSLEEEVFEVEAILDYRVHEGREEFRVKWKGFSMKDCTWEPTINLEGCIDMVKDFKIKHGLWFKREPYKEPPKPEKDRSEESSGQEEDEEKSIAQSAASNEPDEQCLLDKYKAKADHDTTPSVPLEKGDQGYQCERVDNCVTSDDRKIHQPMTLLRMLKNKKEEIFFRVESAGQTKVLPRSKIYKLNINLLLQFYEQYLEIAQNPTFHS